MNVKGYSPGIRNCILIIILSLQVFFKEQEKIHKSQRKWIRGIVVLMWIANSAAGAQIPASAMTT